MEEFKISYLVNKAYSYIEEGNYQKAIELLKKAIELAPLESDLYAYLGEAYYLNNELEKAEEVFKRREKVIIETHYLTPHVKGYKGCILLKKDEKNIKKAKELIEEAIKNNNIKDPELYYNYSIILKKEGKIEESLSYLRKIDELSPTFLYQKIKKLINMI